MSWWQIIYTDEWTRRMVDAVRHRLPNSIGRAAAIAEDVRQELALKLQGKDKPRAVNSYLLTAFQNTLEDYIRRADGYPRPPVWIERLGGVYERVYTLICLEGRTVEEVCGMLVQRMACTDSFVRQVAREIRAGEPNCGQRRREVQLDDAAEELERHSSTQIDRPSSPDRSLPTAEVLAALRALLGEESETPSAERLWAESRTWWQTFTGRVRLTDDERLLLRLIFAEGISLPDAAKMLGTPEHTVRRLLKRKLQELRDIFADLHLLDEETLP